MRMNSNEVYRQSGERAGLSARHRDWSAVTHQQNWFHKALALEDEANRQAIRRVWNEAYRGEQVTKLIYFN